MVPTSTRSSSGSRAAVGLVLLLGILAASGLSTVRGQEAGEGKILGERVCRMCHQKQLKEIPASIHASLSEGEKPHSCESCHGSGEKHIQAALKMEGKPGEIVSFKLLDPTSYSTRCLSCHDKTAKGGHVVGFLESSYIRRGQGCGSCHKAHAPRAAEGGATPAPKKSKIVGTESCLVCHSDRAGMKSYSHGDRVVEMMGCETCHGPGRAHAESRGAAGTIRNPMKMGKGKADSACLLCHSGKTAPDHFKPEPGKERCVDCHTVHVAPDVPAPNPVTPGRPPFKLDLGGDVAAAPVVRPFLMPSLSPMPETEQSLLGFAVGGEIRAGGRLTGVNGSDRIYDKDLGYDSGLRIFDLTLDALAAQGPVSRIHLEAEGIDDPVEHYALSARGGDDWEFTVKAKRENLVYRASADPRDLTARREQLSFALSLFPEDPFRITAGFDIDERDGRKLGTRLLPGGATSVEEPFDETGYRAFLRLDLARGPLTVSLTHQRRWEELEDGIESPPPSGAPNTHLLYEGVTDVRAPLTTVLARYEASEDVLLDAKLLWGRVDADTESESKTTGPGGGAGFVERASEDIRGDRRHIRAEVGGTWFALPELSFAARIEALREQTHSVGEFLTTRSEPPGVSPTVTREEEHIDRDQRRLRISGEAAWRPLAWGSVRAGYERVSDNFEIDENGSEANHHAVIHGPFLGLDLDPRKDLSIEVLYRFVRVDDPFAEISTEDQDHVKIRARWQAREDLRLSAFLIRKLATNQRRDTDILSWSTGLGAFWEPMEDLSIEGGFDYQAFDTETDAVRFFGGTPRFGRSRFTGRTFGVRLFATHGLTPLLRLTAGGSSTRTTGDFETDLLDLTFGAEYDVRKDVTVGTDFRFASYDEDDEGDDDYDAYSLELWLRFSF